MSSERQELKSEASKVSSQATELNSKASQVSSEGSELRSEATELHSLAICYKNALFFLANPDDLVLPGEAAFQGDLRVSFGFLDDY